MAKHISYWIEDIHKIQAKLTKLIMDLDAAKSMNPLIKEAVYGDIHSIQRLLSKGKPK